MTLRRTFFTLVSVAALGALAWSSPATAQYNAFKDPTTGSSKDASATSDFKAVTPTIQGGKIAVGGTAYVVVLFKNQSSSQVTVDNVSLYPSSNVNAAVQLNQCADAPLSPDAQCAITVAVKGLMGGSWRVDALVNHNGRSRLASATMTGDVDQAVEQKSAAKGDVEVQPTNLDFGTSPGGIAMVRPVTLRNLTAEDIKIVNVALDGPDQSGFSYKSGCGETLPAGAICNIIVTWQPTSRGLAQGVLAVRHSGKSGLAQVEVKGTLSPTTSAEGKEVNGTIDLTPSSLDFGTSSGGLGVKKSIVLANRSEEDVELWDIGLDVPDKSGFTYDTQCPETLRPGEICSVVVTWQPVSPGLAQGILSVQHSARSGMSQAEVKGVFQPREEGQRSATGVVSISPESMDFGTSKGGIALVRSLVIANNTSEQVTLTGTALNASEQSGFSYKSQCPDTLPPEGMCNIIMTWQPTTPGLAQGVLDLRHSGKGGLVQAELKGTLQPEEGAPKASTAGVTATPTTLDFGDSQGGIASVRSVILTNNTDKAVDIKSVSIAAPEQAGLSQKSECPATLAAGQACNVVVTWSPTVKGQAQGALIVQHSGKTGMTQIDVKGTLRPEGGRSAEIYPEGLPDRGLLVADRPVVDFGTGIREDSAITATFVNTGSSPLTIKNISLSGIQNNLSLSKGGCAPDIELAPGAACPLTISWSPRRSGALLDSLQIIHTGARGVLVIPVQGTSAAVDSGAPVSGTTGGAFNVPSAEDLLGEVQGATKSSSSSPSSSSSARSSGGGLSRLARAYKITSHSATRAVLNGPDGGQVIRDGEDLVLGGARVTVTIVPAGVILSANGDKVTLPFDSSLKILDQGVSAATVPAAPTPGTPSASAAPSPSPSPSPSPGPGPGSSQSLAPSLFPPNLMQP